MSADVSGPLATEAPADAHPAAAAPAAPSTTQNDEILASITVPASPDRYDNRILWLKARVQQSLLDEFKLTSDNNKASDLFIECLERNNRQSLRELVAYLDDVLNQTALLFYVVNKSSSAGKVRGADLSKVFLFHIWSYFYSHVIRVTLNYVCLCNPCLTASLN